MLPLREVSSNLSNLKPFKHSNFENKVAKLIKDEAEKSKISEKIEEIIVPTHDITEVRRGNELFIPNHVEILESTK